MFDQFAQGQNMIDGRTFSKFCVDCKVVQEQCDKNYIDLVFAKVKEKQERKINFKQFKEAIKLCATKLNMTYAQLETTVCESSGKQL